MTITTKAFWKYAAERALKTFAQTLLAALGLGGVAIGVDQMPWLGALSIAAGAAVISLLTSVTAYTGPAVETPAPEQPVQDFYVPSHSAANAAETQVFPQIDEESPHAPISA